MSDFKIQNIHNEKSVLKTIRMNTKTLNDIEILSQKTNISINRLINQCIIYALDNLDEDSVKELEANNKKNNESN